MKRIVLGVVAGLLSASLSFAQYYDFSCDTANPSESKVIDGVWSGNSPFFRLTIWENGTAPALSNVWYMSFKYSYNRYDTQGMATIPGVWIGTNVVKFRAPTPIFNEDYDSYYFSVFGTNTINEKKTFCTGSMKEYYDPAAGELPGLSFIKTINWDGYTSIGTLPWSYAGTNPVSPAAFMAFTQEVATATNALVSTDTNLQGQINADTNKYVRLDGTKTMTGRLKLGTTNYILEGEATPALSPWTNDVDGGGFFLTNTVVNNFKMLNTNNTTTNRIAGSILWTPVVPTVFTSLVWGATSYTQTLEVQSGSGISFRVEGNTNYIDTTAFTNLHFGVSNYTRIANIQARTGLVFRIQSGTNFIDSIISTNDCITNFVAGANVTLEKTNQVLVITSTQNTNGLYADSNPAGYVTASVTNNCITQLVAGANITIDKTGQYTVVSSAAPFSDTMSTNYFPIVFSYSGVSEPSTNGILWCRNTSGRTWTVTNLMWRCAEGTPMGCIATQGTATAISAWDAAVEDMMVFNITTSNKAATITVSPGHAISGFITNGTGTNTEFTLSVHD